MIQDILITHSGLDDCPASTIDAPDRILIIEGQPLSRLALHSVIDRCLDLQIVAEAQTGLAGVQAYLTNSPDIVIMDLKFRDISGIAAIVAIRQLDARARILVLSNFEGSECLYRALEAGATAYLTKNTDAEELLAAIRCVRQRQFFIQPSLAHLLKDRISGNELTAREQGVLELLLQGLSNKPIADHLGIAEKTVRIHMSSILGKLGATNRTQAVIIALQRGFVDFAPLAVPLPSSDE